MFLVYNLKYKIHVEPYLGFKTYNHTHLLNLDLLLICHCSLLIAHEIASLSSLLIWKHNPTMFAFNLCFTKQRGCRINFFAKVYTIHRVLDNMNTLHIQMAKVVVSKYKYTISHWRLHQVGHIYSMHLRKNNFVQIAFAWHNCNVFAEASFYKHLFKLNYTFRAFDTWLLTKSE